MPTLPPAAIFNLTDPGTFAVVTVKRKCTVCYEFDTSVTSSNLALRYLVVIDGSVATTNDGKPRALGADRKIMVAVNPGSKVALVLNSDVHPNFRRNPVYAVGVGENDVYIKITERLGRISHESAVVGAPIRQRGLKPDTFVDAYSAVLTGDIWMGISNLYTEAEADTMLPPDTDASVRSAVLQIYRGLPTKELVVQFPAGVSASQHILRLRFEESQNVLDNITHCPLLTDVLPRTHPCAYAALLTEARACGVTELRATSGWRPMLGSIAHRAGLGLDINYAESAAQRVQINRASLTNAKLKRNDSVSEREQVLYTKYEQAKNVATARATEFASARKQLAINRDPKEATHLLALFDATETQAGQAKKVMDVAEYEWNRERNLHEPVLIRNLRGKLSHNATINQVLDPWYIDTNTHDHIPAVPNEHCSKNEKIHDNHLHITVAEPKIL